MRDIIKMYISGQNIICTVNGAKIYDQVFFGYTKRQMIAQAKCEIREYLGVKRLVLS